MLTSLRSTLKSTPGMGRLVGLRRTWGPRLAQEGRTLSCRIIAPHALLERSSFRRLRASSSPERNGVFGCCRTKQHNTHITTNRTIVYPWHPWYGQSVVVIREITKSGRAFVHCRLGNRLWMFDAGLCSSFQVRNAPQVHWRALRELGRLLRDAAPHLVEQGHPTGVLGGNAHGPFESVARRRSAESVSSSAGSAPLGSTTIGSAGDNVRASRTDVE